jgi:NADPH:quinone reductase-like Zn-dependent oxidoreductase
VTVCVNPRSQNPVDNELSTLSTIPGCTIGHEFSGIVEKVHPSVTRFKAGDRVAGGTFGSCSTHLHWGAFGEYCIGFEQTALKIPDSVGLEQAVTLPAGVGVAGLVIEALGGEGAFKGKPFFVNGGASGMGMVAIQLMKHLGAAPIIATASPKNFELVKGFGADHVFDYVHPPPLMFAPL